MSAWLALLGLALGAQESADVKSFDSNGVEICYTDRGAGEPLVLLHGLAGNLETWSLPAIGDELPRDYRLIAVDLRGHGRSGKPHQVGRYGLELVEDVARLLDHLSIERAHVFGYSLGGMVALAFVTRHPERVLTTVVGGFGWYRFEPEGSDTFDRLADSLEAGGGLEPLKQRLMAPGEELEPSEQRDAIERSVLARNDRAALVALIRSLRALEVTEQALRANQVPTLAVIGERDGFLPEVERLRGVMEALEIVVVPERDHTGTLTDPLLLRSLRRQLGRVAVEVR